MTPHNSTQQINLNAISPLAEIVIRAGDLTKVTARVELQAGYGPFIGHPGVFGLSVVFHQGFDLDALAKAATFPMARLAIV